jgi:coproporphyrinogen III oxidase-like Fe-S oxidoreductase
MSSGVRVPVSSLYVHVPFCAHKCEYCAFYSEASNGEVINRYVAALVRELEMVADDLRPRTVFFGGGTPSLLNLDQWGKILGAMRRLDLLGAREWTIECNPATVSIDKAGLWRDHGVNRVSMGVQSLNEDLLDRLGRIHSRDMVFKSFEVLRRAGFENINVDLMFAIPGQTLETWRETLDEGMALGSEHLSSYEVIYEEDTPLFHQLQAGEFDVDEELACAMYDELVGRAAGRGFIQYEVANFARETREAIGQRSTTAAARLQSSAPLTPALSPSDGAREEKQCGVDCSGTGNFPLSADAFSLSLSERERAGVRVHSADAMIESGEHLNPATIPAFACRHNVNYWRGGSYYGLGPSAAGYVRGIRTKNIANTQIYCEQLEQGRRPIDWREELPPLRRAGETAAFGLRMNAGWPFASFREATGYDLRAEWQPEMTQLISRGWGALEPERFRLTRDGLRFADAAAEMFLK